METKNLNPIRWRKSVLALMLAAFVLIWFGFVDSYSLLTRFELHHKKSALQDKIDQLHISAEQLESKIDTLNKDTHLLEKIAREEYGMRKPGETVYKIRRSE